MCPGRNKDDCKRDLDLDIKTLKKLKVDVVVSLTTWNELSSMGLQTRLFQSLKDAGIESIHCPVDMDNFNTEQLYETCVKVVQHLENGKTVGT